MNDARDGLAVLPWFWRDWRASTARAVLMALDPGAVTAYRELLEAMWGGEDCSLPDDDATLCALSGVGAARWVKWRKAVLRWLPVGEDGKRRQPRLSHEWRKAILYRASCRAGGHAKAAAMTPEQRSAGAKHAADARWMRGEHASTTHAARTGMRADAWTPSPSPTPSLQGRKNPDPERVRASAGGAAPARRKKADRRSGGCRGPKCADPLCCDVGLRNSRPKKKTA